MSGSLSSLFSDFTSVDLGSHLVVWDIREMRGELRPLAIALIADRVWTQALYDSRTPRALYIDEAASLIEHPAGGQFLATLSRRARKRYLRLVTMTQNPEQFVQDPWGSVVAANAARSAATDSPVRSRCQVTSVGGPLANVILSISSSEGSTTPATASRAAGRSRASAHAAGNTSTQAHW